MAPKVGDTSPTSAPELGKRHEMCDGRIESWTNRVVTVRRCRRAEQSSLSKL